MSEEKRHDSLAPKGAFVGKDADDSERASAETAGLIARSEATHSADDESENTEPEVTIAAFDEPFPTDDALCADDLLAASSTTTETERVSVEDAMRTLIGMRLERSRPSDDFGAFDLARNEPISTPAVPAPTGDPRQMNSLAPIELAPPTPSRLVATQPERKRNPFPILAAAALALLAVGIYRRVDRQPSTTNVQAAAPVAATPVVVQPAVPPQLEATATTEAIAPEDAEEPMQPFGVSESDDAILTLGTPTIINVPEVTDDKKTSSRAPRAAKLSEDKPSVVADAPRKTNGAKSEAAATPTLPDAPSRDAIVAGFNSIRDAVVACANGGGGVAPIEATIMSDGRITHATVGGYYQGTPEGSCIARALRTARFAPFSRANIKVTFPYTL